MGLWIRQGTASCENGATSVSGGSTPWNAIVRAGDGFHFLGDAEVYEIASDADANAAIAFVLPYAGETKSNAPYEILPISIRRQEIASLVLRVDTLLQGIATLITTTGKPADTTGANGTLAIDEDARLMYKKTDGVWDNGTSIGGPGYGGASTTSQAIQTGSPVTFDFPGGYAWVAGGRIRAIAVGSDPLAWMEGPISAYGSGELSFTPDLAAGSGTFESWEFSAAGERGGTGAPGSDGEDGVDGWSPVFAVTADGARDVLKVVDWTGGTGTKPATGKYVGATGFVDLIADGVDLRGVQGDPGDPGDQGPAGLTLRGEYDDGTTYNADDVVVNEGSAWRAKTTTIGVSPPSLPTTSNDSFELFAAKGDKGDPGDPGEPGADGTDGTNFSPDAVGEFVDRSTYDGEASGFCFLSLDGDGDAISTGVLFFKQSATSGDWSTPVLFQGPTGPAGIRWIDGDYNDASSYAVNDAVRDQNAAWRCKLATSGGNPPPTFPTSSNAYWELLAGAGVSDYNDLSNKPTLGTSSALDVDTDPEMAADSDDVVPSQKAVRAFVGSKVANVFAYQTSWDASAGSFPGAGSAKVGQTWRCSVAGAVDGVSFTVGDLVAAITDNASTTTFAGNWDKFESSLSSAEIIAALNAGAIAYAKIQNVSATDKLLGRASAGAGVIEEISCNALGRSLLNTTSIGVFDVVAAQGADIATAATIDLNSATGPVVNLTGTTACSAVTLGAGKTRICRAAGEFQLTASSNLIVNGQTAVNYTTKANDLLLFEGFASSVVRVWLIGSGNGPHGIDILASGTASGAALSFSGDFTKYRKIEIIGTNFSHNNASANIGFKVSADGGSTFLTINFHAIVNNNGALTGSNLSVSQVDLIGALVAASTNDMCFKVEILEPGSAVAKDLLTQGSSFGNTIYRQNFAKLQAGAINNIQIVPSTGSFDAGDYEVLGYY